MINSEDGYELVGGTTKNPIDESEFTRCGEIEFIFRPFPPVVSQNSIQQAWMGRWERVWRAFYGWDIQDYLEILKHLPYLLITEWPQSNEAFPLLYSKKISYELGIYPWLRNWFGLQPNPTGEFVLPYRDEARRIKIRFELAEIFFNHDSPLLNLGWNLSTEGFGPVLFSSPGHLGFWSEIARCRQWLINTNASHFPGVPRSPKRQGKRAARKQASAPPEPRQTLKDWNELLIKLPNVIEATAAEMVSNRSRFGLFEGRDRIKVLLKEIADIKFRKVQEVDRSDDFQFAWIEENGQFFVTGQGFNIPQPKKRKPRK